MALTQDQYPQLQTLQTIIITLSNILDAEAKLVDTTPSLMSPANIANLNNTIEKALAAIDEIINPVLP